VRSGASKQLRGAAGGPGDHRTLPPPSGDSTSEDDDVDDDDARQVCCGARGAPGGAARPKSLRTTDQARVY
jgi:hypothetical protein